MFKTTIAAACSALLLMSAAPALARSPVSQDNPRDKARPARLEQVRYPTAGVQVPARFFIAAGEGPHPTVLLLHGFPGTELNLDLARAMQRAGWNVLAIHYRGVWGAPGQNGIDNGVADSRAALDWLLLPETRRLYRVDPKRLVVLGHSMGGFNAVTMGEDPRIAGFVLIASADMGRYAAYFSQPDRQATGETLFAEDLSYTNMTWPMLLAEFKARGATWDRAANAAELAGRPALIISSDDEGEHEDGDAIAAAIKGAGGPAPARMRMATDHSFNDHRVALATAVTAWLEKTF